MIGLFIRFFLFAAASVLNAQGAPSPGLGGAEPGAASLEAEPGGGRESAPETSLPPALLVFQPEVASDSRSEPGGLVRILARSPEGIDSLSGLLVDGNGKLFSKATFFRLDPVSKESQWVGLLGIPSTMEKGDFRLIVTAERATMSNIQVLAVTIAARSFAREEIPLDQTLTTLRAVPDPRKTAEARELAKTLSIPHQDAFYEQGSFLRPVEPIRKSAGYGDRRQYRYSDNRVEVSVHNGIDYALAEGSPVAACGKGRVVMAVDRIMTGKTVVVEHLPGVFSLYFHLSEIAVRTGDVLEKGQILGLVGHTGLATGSHLHWELEVNSVAVDPERFLTSAILDKSPAFGSIFTTAPREGR